jgi:hypothetical protein
LDDILIIAAVVCVAFLLFSRKVRKSTMWRAMVTPLASIIGSGFLVLGPILDHAYGAQAIVVMLFLCVASFGFGSAIRFNLAHMSQHGAADRRTMRTIEEVASWALALAYVVSVAYYLNLFGAFSVKMTVVDTPLHANLVTTAAFLTIMAVGWTRGFKSLERLEYITVSAKLAIIAGLLVGLVAFFHKQASSGALVVNAPQISGWQAATLAFGLIITVQGFETYRYLTAEYDTKTCIRSMLWAQIVASGIYLSYVALISFVFKQGQIEISETAIIDLMEIVAPILPAFLIAAALAAQFSAAVADTSGSGGLVQELTGERLSSRVSYVILGVVGIGFTWVADVFQLINYASRAFAAYYAIQSGIAALNAWRARHMLRLFLYAGLTVLGILIVFTGAAVEAHS